MTHDRTQTKLSRRQLLLAGSAAVAASGLELAFPTLARAKELSEMLEEESRLSKRIVELRLELEKETDAYHRAVEEHDSALLAVNKAQAKIDANTEEIKDLQSKLMERVRAQYRSDDMSMFDVLFESADFEEFANRWAMIERLNDSDIAMVEKIKGLRDDNETEKSTLQEQEQIVRTKMEEAQRLEAECQLKITESEQLLEKVTAETEELIRRDQEAALAFSTGKVTIIGNPRNLEPTPEVVDVARSCMGIPYVWGGKGPDVFDCSGLVAWCYGRIGIGIPSYTESEYALALAVGAVLPLSEVEPGDVLYRPGHVGIAAHKGGLPYIHAPHTGAVVRDTDTLAYAKFVCGLRFPRGLHITYISEDVNSYQNAARNGALTNTTTNTFTGTTTNTTTSSFSSSSSSRTTVYDDGSGNEVKISEPKESPITPGKPSILIPGSAEYNGF